MKAKLNTLLLVVFVFLSSTTANAFDIQIWGPNTDEKPRVREEDGNALFTFGFRSLVPGSYDAFKGVCITVRYYYEKEGIDLLGNNEKVIHSEKVTFELGRDDIRSRGSKPKNWATKLGRSHFKSQDFGTYAGDDYPYTLEITNVIECPDHAGVFVLELFALVGLLSTRKLFLKR